MLAQHEWLDKAKRLAVGMRVRIKHGNERRPNMIIANEGDRWWAYCQACKDGGVERKEHVMLGVPNAAPDVCLLAPSDFVPVLGCEYETRIATFLATKHMDLMYLPPVYYSPSRARLLIETPHGLLGRDVTEKSPAKWLVYSGAKFLGQTHGTRIAVVVEDAFSYYKVAYALRDEPVDVICALGTGITDALVLELLRARAVIFMFDGDNAGWKGAHDGVVRMCGMGIRANSCCAPAGKDPKDLSCGEIRALLGGQCNADASR